MARLALLLALAGCTARDRVFAVDEPSANLVLSQAHQSFGEVLVGASATATVRVSNNGSAPSTPLSPSVQGDRAFAVSGTCAVDALAPGASCELLLTFAPSASGRAAATVAVAGPLAVTVDGNGKPRPPANLVLSQARQSFGGVQIGTSAAATIHISNQGGSPSAPLSPEISGDAAFGVDGTCAGALAPGGSCDLRVTFAPASFGDAAATVAIAGPLALAVDGYGSGTTTLSLQPSVGGSLNLCAAGTCTIPYPVGGTVPVADLRATPSPGWSVLAWTGDCAGSAETCQLRMDRDRSAGVTFVRVVTLTVEATSLAAGGGSIRVAAETCVVPCRLTTTVPARTQVAVHAEPDASSQFRWTQGCHAGRGDCTLRLDADTAVTAVFNGANYVFVTSSKHSSDEGVAAYDAACNQRAEEAGLPGPYRAWISTSGTPAERRFANARGFIRLDGRPFMDTLDPAAPVAYPVAYAETGERFTGLGFDGMFLSGRSLYNGGAIATCHDWTSASEDWNDGGVILGNPLAGTIFWDGGASSNTCGVTWRLLCAGTALTRPLRVEPARGRFAFPTEIDSLRWLPADAGVAGFDAECAREAAAAQLPGTYKALVATEGASAVSRFDLNGAPWVRPDGVALVARAADLATGDLLATFNVSADGRYDDDSFGFWTGAPTPATPGTAATTCNNWTSASAADYGMGGWNLDLTRGFLFDFGLDECQYTKRVYCLQE